MYAPAVSRDATFRALCAVLAHEEWEMHSIVISNTFLYETLGEHVYMQLHLHLMVSVAGCTN